MKTSKKFLSLLLAIIMIVGTVPVAFAEGNTYKVGDIIQFGSYPQNEVEDETLIAELNALAPEWDEWTSYGYYSGDNNYGSMVQGDWMRYTDIIYNGNKYRGVKFARYRPYQTIKSSVYKLQFDNGYITDTVYWFKFESINWRVLDPNTHLVVCESIIDSQPYSNTIYQKSSAVIGSYNYFNDIACQNYASDYETSSIRQWLNDDFYNLAFTESEKRTINISTLNNGSSEIEDKIFLLSDEEVKNSDFGFSTSNTVGDEARIGRGSKYAMCQGLGVGTSDYNSDWILRSSARDNTLCRYVNLNGALQNGFVCYTFGIRPALRLGSFTHKHTYNGEITIFATHTQEGVKTFTCECGDSYTEPVAKTTEHTYTSEITVQPTHLKTGVETFTCECGDTYTETIEKIAKHSYEVAVIDPTCIAKGYTIYTCECNDSYITDYVNETGHNFKAVVTEPTCTEHGYTTYICVCGETYIRDYTNATNHIDSNTDYECDFACGYKFDKPVDPTPEEPSIPDASDGPDEPCSCNCHKGGIVGFFYKIIIFFQKLFGMNKICVCGVKH